jgi:hypothetical protein
MKTVREYRQQAEECRELAKRARSADEREAILAIAVSWENLAAARAQDHERAACVKGPAQLASEGADSQGQNAKCSP